MRCIGGSWDGKDAESADGGHILRVYVPTQATADWSGECEPQIAESKYDTYIRNSITCPASMGPQVEKVQFWVIHGMSMAEALERLLRLYRPPLKINQYGEEEAPR